MKFYIKNNNLYYYNYLITDRRLSLFLVPLSIIILLNKNYIHYFSYIFTYIALIGTIDTIAAFIKYKLYLVLISGIIFHCLLLYPFINFKKYFKPNVLQYILGLLALLILIFLPYWPYELSRNVFISTLIINYIILTLIYEFLY